GDEGADTDRLAQDATRAAVFFEAEVLQDADGGLEVVDADSGLGAVGQPLRGPHLEHDGVTQLGHALLEFGDDAVQDSEAFLARGARPAAEGGGGGLYGAVRVGSTADIDATGCLTRGG